MDERSLAEMASRVAGCATASTPDYLGEVMELVTQCRTDIAAVADGWIEGRLTEEAYKAMSKIMPARGSAGEPERTR